MRTAITIIVTAIAVSLAWFWTLRYRPNWIAKIMLDGNGFPRIKKAGDRFVVGGNLFFFNGEQWVQLSNVTGFPINPAPKEGDTFIIDKVGYKFTGGSWVKITGPSENETERSIMGFSLARQRLMDQAIGMYKNHRNANQIKNKLASMTNVELGNVVSQKVVWCTCGDTEYGFTTDCRTACA